MVVIHVKFSDVDQFKYECSCNDDNDKIIRDIAYINNKRHLIQRLSDEFDRLFKYGPSKPLDKQGLDEYSDVTIDKGEFYTSDPLGKRNGNGIDLNFATKLMIHIAEAKAYVNKDQAINNVAINVDGIKSKIENLKGVLIMAYPMGIPEYDPVREMLEEREVIEGTGFFHDYYEPSTCTLWWANKELNRKEKLIQRIGKNEKTMVIAKLQKKEAGAPMRQPGITEEERKQMMAKYYKRQEELKKLAEDDDDAFLSSSWANPKTLKSELHGINNNIRMR